MISRNLPHAVHDKCYYEDTQKDREYSNDNKRAGIWALF